MNLLQKLTIKNLKLNKKRTIVTIIGIVLSVALLTAVSSMYSSVLSSLVNYAKNEKGDFHVSFNNVPIEDAKTISNNRKVQKISLTEGIGYAYLNESKNEDKPYFYLIGADQNALDNLSFKLIEGRLPENDTEIVITTHLKTNGRVDYKIGDSITLNIGDRISDGYSLNQDNPYSYSLEKLEVKFEKKYKIVGKIERPATNIEPYSAPGYTIITKKNVSDMKTVKVYTRYTKDGLKEYERVTATILGIDPSIFTKYINNEYETIEEIDEAAKIISNSKYEVNMNEYLILLERAPLSEGTMKGLGFVVIIICIIIIISSVFCIKNSFDISITEKTMQYGMLRSMGATKKQIKHNVLYEAFILGIVSIPIGLIFGLFASFILCKICNYLLVDMITYGFSIPFVINMYALIFSIILGIITIYLSALKSARRASKITPIESIRNSGGIKIKRIKSNKLINKLFGIGGIISYKNVKRNKKKYRTTVISIVVSSIVFIALSYFIGLFYTELEKDFSYADHNISFSLKNTKENNTKLNEILNDESIIEYNVINEINGEMDNAVLNKEYFEKIEDSYIKNTIDENENVYKEVVFLSMNDTEYKKFCEDNLIDYNYAKDKILLYDTVSYKENKNNKIMDANVRMYTNKKGDNITLSLGDEKLETEIADIVYKKPFGLSTTFFDNSIIIMNRETFNKLEKNEYSFNIYINSSNPNKLQDTIEKILNDEEVSIYNIEETNRLSRNLLLLICIFLYGFIIVVTLIGVTNIFNTITTNMELRKPEFAMLKSIGMTTKEFNRMIRLETIFICVKSMFFAIPIGLLISYLIYYKLGTDSFSIPYLAILLNILAVIVLISIIMKFSINKINKQNTIETIRNENI